MKNVNVQLRQSVFSSLKKESAKNSRPNSGHRLFSVHSSQMSSSRKFGSRQNSDLVVLSACSGMYLGESPELGTQENRKTADAFKHGGIRLGSPLFDLP